MYLTTPQLIYCFQLHPKTNWTVEERKWSSKLSQNGRTKKIDHILIHSPRLLLFIHLYLFVLCSLFKEKYLKRYSNKSIASENYLNFILIFSSGILSLCFTSNGEALYLQSSSELQRLTVAANHARAARGLAAAQEGPRRRGARGGEEGVEGERGSARCGGRAEDADEREAGQRRRLQPQGEHARGVQARDFADVDWHHDWLHQGPFGVRAFFFLIACSVRLFSLNLRYFFFFFLRNLKYVDCMSCSQIFEMNLNDKEIGWNEWGNGS